MCLVSPSSSPTTRAACIGRRLCWVRTPTRSCASWGTVRMRFAICTIVTSLENAWEQGTIMNYATPQQERPPVAVTEVGTRDGFQAEARFIDTAIKAGIIDAMIAAGVRHIEATSFVSPRAVPQLADAHEVLSRLTRRKDAHIAALVPNARGAERALGAGVDEAVCFVSASETHNRANLNASIGDALANVAEVAK